MDSQAVSAPSVPSLPPPPLPAHSFPPESNIEPSLPVESASSSSQNSQELSLSITDSDSVASFTGSEAGSQISSSSAGARFPNSGAASPTKDTVEIRAVHNVSEQYRRKYLKSCFDNLQKEVVAESTAKASHLLIINSALEAIQRVREQDFQLRRDYERAAAEQKQLQVRFGEVVREIQVLVPDFDATKLLIECELATPEDFQPAAPFDRQDPFLEETVEIVSPASSQKRSLGDISDEAEPVVSRKAPKMSPALTTSSRRKDSKRGKNKMSETVEVPSPSPPVESDQMSENGKQNGIALSNGPTQKPPIEPIPLRYIDEPDEGMADPEVPLPILRNTLYNMNTTSASSMAERRKLAAEKNLPVHLAYGIPTLPGGNYWSQSLSPFPMVVRRNRPSFPTKKFEIVTGASSRLKPSAALPPAALPEAKAPVPAPSGTV